MGSKGSKRKSSSKLDETELLVEEIHLLLKTTKYTENEIKNWHAAFIRDCPTGKLDKKMFIDIYKKYYPDGKSDKFCGYVFKAFDLNSSGAIDFVEFLMAVSIINQGTIKEKLRMSFNLFDIDKNGCIDTKEMEALILAIYDLVDEKNRKGANAPSEKVKQIMVKLDKNHDGKLQIDEFINGCLHDESLRKYENLHASCRCY